MEVVSSLHNGIGGWELPWLLSSEGSITGIGIVDERLLLERLYVR